MYNNKSVLFEELIPEDFNSRLNDAPIAYIPLGTLEWHGPHMPLGADGLQSKGFFKKLAEAVGGIVLPMLFQGPDTKTVIDDEIFYGMDVCGGNFTGNMVYENQKLTGSVYHIEKDIFITILDTLCMNLSRMGFKIIVAHGHGPSILAYQSMIPEIERKYNVKCFHCWGDFSISDEIYYGLQVDHGGSNETSIMLSVNEQLVKMEKLPQDMNEWPLAIGMGDPRLYASKEFGDKVVDYQLKRMSEILKERLEEIKNR